MLNENKEQDKDKLIDFNETLLALMNAAAERNLDKIRLYTKHALELARAIGLPYLEVNVLTVAANAFLTENQLQAAVKIFDEALLCVKKALLNSVTQEDAHEKSLYEQLEVQVLFYKGGALLSNKTPQYNTIIEVYQQADDALQKIMVEPNKTTNSEAGGGFHYIYSFEVLRLLGYCQEQLGRQQAALKHYVKAVNTAEKMDEELRKKSLLKTVGLAMLSICHKQGMKQEFFTVINKINGLIGIGWEKKTPSAA
jgi:tetratricopeptide (TPR) repeat protein